MPIQKEIPFLFYSVPPALFTAASINQFASEDVKTQLSIFHLDDRAEIKNQGGSRNNER